jgi:predicted AAA+ superfamily ATPase
LDPPVLDRPRHLGTVTELLAWSPVVAVLGARQVGKTTLAQEIVRRRQERATVFDLERAAGRGHRRRRA